MKRPNRETVILAHRLGAKMIDLAEQEKYDERFVALLRLGNSLISVGEPWGFDLNKLTDDDRKLIAEINKQIAS
jgi:hypothetical protein